MRMILMLTAVLLAGCASAPPVTQIIEVPVYVSCVKEAPKRPDFEFGSLPLDASDGQKVMALARDWAKGRNYEFHLEAAVIGCQ